MTHYLSFNIISCNLFSLCILFLVNQRKKRIKNLPLIGAGTVIGTENKQKMHLLEFYMYISITSWDSRGCDHMVVGFTTTYVISAYHH